MTPASSSTRLVFTHDYVFHSVQGEGRFIGVPSVFVRLSGCNLRCQWQNRDGTTTLCDTPYSSHTPESHIRAIEETVTQVRYFQCKHVVVTGGEPFLQKGVPELVEALVGYGHYVTVETNGTVYLPTKAQFLSISPKLKSSIVSHSPHFTSHNAHRLNMIALAELVKTEHQLKFVMNEEGDVEEIVAILSSLRESNGSYDESNVCLMPQGISEEELREKTPWVIEVCKKHNWRFSDRLHIRIWGNKRGV